MADIKINKSSKIIVATTAINTLLIKEILLSNFRNSNNPINKIK